MQQSLKSALFILLLLCPLLSQAQKFGYIDTQRILEKMPAYKEAETQIQKLTDNWLVEIDAKRKEIETLQTAFQAEEVLLTPEMREKRQQEITLKQNNLREFQNNAFGYEGLLYLKRQELMKPLQEEIAKAAQVVAQKQRLQFLFDKAADIVMIYADPRHNYTDYVLEELGLGDPADTEQ
jgi:outer membrane protein